MQCAILAAVVAPPAQADSRPVRLVVSIAAGGTTVVVENRPGGNGTIAAAAGADAGSGDPSVLIIPSSIVQNASLRIVKIIIGNDLDA